MGYQTNYTLTLNLLIGGKKAFLADDSPLRLIIERLRKENAEAGYSLTPSGSASGNDSRWYEHEKDLRAYSSQHPGILFTLHGEGKDSGDIWNKYFLDGKCQVAKPEIRIPEFDPKQLR